MKFNLDLLLYLCVCVYCDNMHVCVCVMDLTHIALNCLGLGCFQLLSIFIRCETWTLILLDFI